MIFTCMHVWYPHIGFNTINHLSETLVYTKHEIWWSQCQFKKQITTNWSVCEIHVNKIHCKKGQIERWKMSRQSSCVIVFLTHLILFVNIIFLISFFFYTCIINKTILAREHFSTKSFLRMYNRQTCKFLTSWQSKILK